MTARLDFFGKPRKDRREFVTRIVTEARARLLIEDWGFQVYLSRKPAAKGDDTVASIDSNEQYRDGTITIYPSFWLYPADYQRRALLHELVHAVTNRFANVAVRGEKRLLNRDEIVDAEENLVEHITNIVWDAYEERD